MRYQIKHALVQYAANTILEDVNFEIHDKEKIAIVGRNGCGKTTLLKLIAGDIHMNNLDSDEECGIVMAGKQEIGFLRQISFPDGDVTVEEEIKKTFAPVFACEKRMEELEKLMQEEGESPALFGEYDFWQKKMEALQGYTWKRDMEVMFQQFGFALEELQRPIGSFSGGQQTKVAATRSKRMAIEHMVKIEKPRRFDTKTFHILFKPNMESYSDVMIAKNLKIGYDSVLSQVNFHLRKKERLAILGENGKGKSTLLKTLVEMIPSLGGSFVIGQNVEYGYYGQAGIRTNAASV